MMRSGPYLADGGEHLGLARLIGLSSGSHPGSGPKGQGCTEQQGDDSSGRNSLKQHPSTRPIALDGIGYEAG